MTAPRTTASTGTMQVLMRPWGAMHYRIYGPDDGPTVVFANSFGTDLRLWDGLLPHLPTHLRLVRYDKRGHGLSDPDGPATIEECVDDAIALTKATASGPVILVGMSIGGLIAQAVASAAQHAGRDLAGQRRRAVGPPCLKTGLRGTDHGPTPALS
jgi:pimeloyl-ACP methyl ester carboxylesterase